MKETVKDWFAKAEADYRTAGRELGAEESPNYDAVCFHAQQCVEKLMKAALLHLEVVPPRTHDLVHLDRLLAPVHPGWSPAVEDLRLLTRAATLCRYPGESADREDAEDAKNTCRRLREKLLPILDQ
jgi:HEPN domain-containing protein